MVGDGVGWGGWWVGVKGKEVDGCEGVSGEERRGWVWVGR